jgi:hypothetical protein
LECGNKVFIRNVKEVKDLQSDAGIYTCTVCKAKYLIEEDKGEGLFESENAQPKRIG